jgi:hypothetical protein
MHTNSFSTPLLPFSQGQLPTGKAGGGGGNGDGWAGGGHGGDGGLGGNMEQHPKQSEQPSALLISCACMQDMDKNEVQGIDPVAGENKHCPAHPAG